jgi:hypothetical protein
MVDQEIFIEDIIIPARAPALPGPKYELGKEVDKIDEKMLKDDLLLLRFKEGEVQANYKVGDKKYTKYLSLDSLSTIFKNDTRYDTGMMELSGTDYCGVRRYIKQGSTEILILEASAGKRAIRFADYTVPTISGQTYFPTVLMALILRDGVHHTSYCWATQFPVVTEAVKLYRFPFGNVYHGNERVCWGVKTPEFGKEVNKFHALAYFLDAPYNAHLQFSYRPMPTGNELAVILKWLDEQTSFDYNGLTAAKTEGLTTQSTFKSVLKYLEDSYARG